MSHYAKGGNTVSQQSSGLRFDIYERVHLPEDGAGMRELTSIELTPEITVDRQGEQAVLKGYLILSGSYASVEEAMGEEQLTHRIPVEITLPMNRIHNVNDISVEIENFDVDLLSSRSLNVTGVLSLNGIEMVKSGTAGWREEEEVVFTHRAEEPAQDPPPWTAEQTTDRPQYSPEFEAVPNVAEENERGAAAAEGSGSALYAAAGGDDSEETDAAEAAAASAQEEKKEIKIAFSGKSGYEVIDEQFSGLNTLLGTSAGVREEASYSPQPTAPDHSAVAAASAGKGSLDTDGRDRLEWKKLFLTAATDEPQFRRVKMCIARKEDTIETIAERYKKSPRELMLYNRLNDQYLQEGQVVYIP
jgi:stage VI sporulation protein D